MGKGAGKTHATEGGSSDGVENKTAFAYEFGGPAGTAVLMMVLPMVVYFLYLACGPYGVATVSLAAPFVHLPPALLDGSALHDPAQPWFTLEALAVVVGWLLLQALFYAVLPGPMAEGVELDPQTPGARRLRYPMNGLAAFFVSVLGAVLGHALGVIDLSYCYHEFLPLATGAIIVSVALSVYLYLSSLVVVPASTPANAPERALLAAGGDSGSPVYDAFMGRELNPRIALPGGFSFDLKVFCELRPGLIGWILLDLGCAAEQYASHGSITNSMMLVLAFQTYYVFDSFYNEPAILTTMDVTTDGFGFMLAFGDLAWVPFTYSLQARYLVLNPLELSTLTVLAIIATKLIGLYIFRGANSQKNAFRSGSTDPSILALEYITTERGSRLITSGWWGVARHVNYLGDWIMAWAWCLPTLFHTPITYYYVIYFGILLVHRDLRDDHKCATKYGKDWKRYCSIVRWRILPGIY
ncbi:Delta(14)-sterol reductase [Thecamonas trahens ATCC 50062]|uniref:Delta(14)-sterol reductase ERG24 n=1 Tax=Thecamonas trahens ATCC 50062 TaxID=461836 RepID=A0A0L0D198_THETB|nr:Delta(14)-sterol reductase [Thecamonas trahens ATCC 50062]KNC46017.1 Delta(14)-sterol reductase [Thecamonas trahens ATCC 50062]|eukprot:XP_013762997.1 Delta(14)-sterol reductase [Thecamonas trahens ATCC 50062]